MVDKPAKEFGALFCLLLLDLILQVCLGRLEVTCTVTLTTDVPAILAGAPVNTEFRKHSHSNPSEGARQYVCIGIKNS